MVIGHVTAAFTTGNMRQRRSSERSRSYLSVPVTRSRGLRSNLRRGAPIGRVSWLERFVRRGDRRHLPRPGNPAARHGRALARPPRVGGRRRRPRPRSASRSPTSCSTRPPRRSPAPARPSSRSCSPRSSRGRRSATASPDPVAFAGHSLGQVTALIAAGALALDDGVRFAARRAELTQAAADAHPGRMAALLGATRRAGRGRVRRRARRVLGRERQRTRAGRDRGHARRRRRRRAHARKELGVKRATPLNVGGAFHTPLMRDAADALADRARRPSRSRHPTAPVVSNHDARRLRRRRRMARALCRSTSPCPCAGASRWRPWSTLGADLVPRGRPRLDARRPGQAHRPRRPGARRRDPRRPRIARWRWSDGSPARPRRRPARPGADDRRARRSACSVPSTLDEGGAGHARPDGRHGRRTGHVDAGREPVRRASSSACSRTRASACAKASPSPGSGCTERRGTIGTCGCIAGWGTAVPEQRLTNADLEQRVDTTDEWIVERTGIRERRVAATDETTASLAIEAGTAAIKQAGITPGRHRPPHRRDRDARAADPPHRRVRRRGPRPALRFVRPRRRVRGLRLRARHRRVAAHDAATSTTCS